MCKIYNYSRVITARLTKITDGLLLKEQTRFHKDIGNIFIIQQVMEVAENLIEQHIYYSLTNKSFWKG